MSEPTYRIEPRAGINGGYDIEHVVGDTSAVVANCLMREDADRIASLLTQDDERIAREGHRQREQVAYDTDAGALPMDHPRRMLWAAWWFAQQRDAPLAELDRLEAAYRATQEQGMSDDTKRDGWPTTVDPHPEQWPVTTDPRPQDWPTVQPIPPAPVHVGD